MDRSPSILRGGRSGGWVSEEGYRVVQLGGRPSWVVQGHCGGSVSFPVQQPFPPSPGTVLRCLWEPASPPTSDSMASARLCLFSTAAGGGPSTKLFSGMEFSCMGLRWKLLERDAFFLVELEPEKMKTWNAQAHCYHGRAESKTMWNRLEKGLEKLEG